MDKDNTGELELEDMKESEYCSAISSPVLPVGSLKVNASGMGI